MEPHGGAGLVNTHKHAHSLLFRMHFTSSHISASPARAHTLYGLPFISVPLRNLTHLGVRAFYELKCVCMRLCFVCVFAGSTKHTDSFPIDAGRVELCRNRPPSLYVMLV